MIAALLAVVLAFAQGGGDDLPPGILLLSRIKRHVREETLRLPDYTCLQTASRFRLPGGGKRPEDVVMLEVLNAGSKELYASPGATNFRDESPSAFAAGGMSGTGMFGLHLRTIFVNDSAMFTYRGEEDAGGRRAVRYDYRVPQFLSGYTIQRMYAQAVVGMRGSFWADPETLDLLWLEVNADDLPDRLELTSATLTIDYARMRIGEREIVLPQSAEMRMVDRDGSESRNLVEFTHCRSFAAQSSVRFDAPAVPGALGGLPAAPAEAVAIPAGLMVTIELWSPVTSGEKVGTLIEGRVAADVRQKGKVVIPAGAVARGRLRRMERQDEYWMVGLEFTDVEIGGATARFYGNVQDVDKPARFAMQTTTRGPRRAMENVYAGYVPGVALFLVPGKELDLARGFKTVWRTGPARM